MTSPTILPVTHQRDWDAYWLQRAQLNATMSTCISRQVGAVAVRDRRSFADGFNGNIPGAKHCIDGGCTRCWNRAHPASPHGGIAAGASLEICVCVHSEQNVVAFCAREGIRLNGATLYSTHKPCLDCFKLLTVAGVSEIVYDEDYPGEYDIPSFMRIRRFSGS